MLFTSGGAARDRRPLLMRLVRFSLSAWIAVLLVGAFQLAGAAGVVLAAEDQGTLRTGGTGAALEGMAQVAAAYHKKYPGVRVFISPSLGSTGGIKAVVAGVLDLGMSARPLTEAELRQGAVAVEYGRTPVMLVTSHQGPGINFTLREIASLYLGEIKSYPDGTPIRLILRPMVDADTSFLLSLSPEMADAVRKAHAREGMIVAATDRDNANAMERIRGAIGWMTLAQLISEKPASYTFSSRWHQAQPRNLGCRRLSILQTFFCGYRNKPRPAGHILY